MCFCVLVVLCYCWWVIGKTFSHLAVAPCETSRSVYTLSPNLVGPTGTLSGGCTEITSTKHNSSSLLRVFIIFLMRPVCHSGMGDLTEDWQKNKQEVCPVLYGLFLWHSSLGTAGLLWEPVQTKHAHCSNLPPQKTSCSKMEGFSSSKPKWNEMHMLTGADRGHGSLF